MMQTKLFFLLALLQQTVNIQACPFHLADTSHSQTINNERRSTPNEVTKTAIENVRIFNGVDFETPSTVCLDGGYITNLDECSEAKTTVDGTGKFLIPGLVDSHLHLSDVQSLEDFTSYGLTTAMHMNCGNYTQCKAMEDLPGLANFVHAGRSAVGKNSSHEKTDPTRPKDTLIYPNTNVIQWTDWQFGNGSNFMKITAEVNGPSTEQQVQIVEHTHSKYRAQTMTHASAVMSYQQAVASKTDGIQHLPDDGILDNTTIQAILAQGQFVTPTLNVFEYAYRTPALQQYFGVSAGSNRTLEHVETNVRLLYQAGVPLIAGTDSVGTLVQNGTSVSVPWGLTLHYEMENFVNIVGMSPAEAINAATREAAKWHRVPDRGSVAVGQRADVLMLNSNPLLNITNTRDIAKAWAFGFEVASLAAVNSSDVNPGNLPET